MVVETLYNIGMIKNEESKLQSALFKFQQEGVEWLVEHPRGVLADECGFVFTTEQKTML